MKEQDASIAERALRASLESAARAGRALLAGEAATDLDRESLALLLTSFEQTAKTLVVSQ